MTPLENNKENPVFNFFFHPEKMKGSTQVFSIITTVALSLLTGLAYLIPFTILHLKNRVHETPKEAEKVAQVSHRHFLAGQREPEEVKTLVELTPLSVSEIRSVENNEGVEKRNELAIGLIRFLEDRLIEQKTTISNKDDTPSYIGQSLANLKNELQKLFPEMDPVSMEKEERKVLEASLYYFFSKNDYDFKINFVQRSYLVYRLIAEFEAESFKDTLQDILNKYDLKQVATTKAVPGDGNCFLWSCATSKKLREMGDLSIKEIEHFNVKKACAEDQKDLRDLMLKQFDEMIINGDKSELQTFMTYIAYNADFQKIRKGLSDEELEDLVASGSPSSQIIEGYKKMLKSSGTWNGDFEINLLARAIQRPIIAVFKDNHSEKIRNTIFGGCQFYHPDIPPIFVKFADSHYEALLPFVKD